MTTFANAQRVKSGRVIAEPFWLYVTQPTPDTVAVYRSIGVKDTDPMMKPVHELTAGADVIDRRTVDDEYMMDGKAEYTLYTAAALADAA
ncbi:hypothetical protein [Mycolicibacterium sp. HS_4_1]